MNKDLFKDEYLKFIFSYKVKNYRQQKGYSLSELASHTGLSVSYLSEIEKGIKYPKLEKIVLLSRVLGISYDELVTAKLGDNMSNVSTILNSQLWNEFPFEQFGLSIHTLFKLLTDSPSKASALIKTIYEIGKNYDMQSEHFLLATLRSFQIMNLNYFGEAENAAKSFISESGLTFEDCRNYKTIHRLFTKKFRVTVDDKTLGGYPELKNFRSVYKKKNGKKMIFLNPLLDDSQRLFVLLKEIGYHAMGLEERTATFTMFKPQTFNEVFNSFLSSYFAGAVIVPAASLIEKLKTMFAKPAFQHEEIEHLLKYYQVTPETILHRYSQLLPKFFGFTIHYMRFMQKNNEPSYLDKELNISDVFTARGSSEHHCAKWLASKSLKYFKDEKNKNQYGIYAQRSRFIKTDKEFFNLTICRKLNIKQDTITSMTLGILNDDAFKKAVRFWDDSNVPQDSVNETCERCYLNKDECAFRLAPPTIFNKEQKQERIKHLLEGL